jgi:hypothetical protein
LGFRVRVQAYQQRGAHGVGGEAHAHRLARLAVLPPPLIVGVLDAHLGQRLAVAAQVEIESKV